ncbi:hypothetical protein AAHC03_04475 [Spirometra sp. Aus1]
MAFINPKKRSSYILTTAGTSIATDDSNIGQQLLKKMGWTPATGLGKDGTGIVDPIKSSCNYGRKGLGKGAMESDTGMVQQLAFSEILKSLSKHKPQASSTKTSLEDKSKNSRSRVHYGKFVRAKDVSQYSKESLKVVLGAPLSAPDTPRQSVDDMAVPTTGAVQDPGTVHQDFGIKTYSSALDLKDYFAMKRRRKAEGSTLDSDRVPKRRELSPSALANAPVCFSLGSHSEEETEPNPGGGSPERSRDVNDGSGSYEEGPTEVAPVLSEARQGSPKNSKAVSDESESSSDEEEPEEAAPTQSDVCKEASAAFASSNLSLLPGYRYY